MNRYLSVFGLAARSTLVKLIMIIAAMGAVQVGMFIYALNQAEGSVLLENFIKDSKIIYVLGISFLAYYATLCGVSKNTSNAMMTMHRLMIPERTANWIIVIYNIMALVIFLAAELGICLALAKVYLNSDISGQYQHVLFTAFYRSNLLHPLLPMEDYVTLANDILLIISLAVIAAFAQQHHRRGKHDAFSGAAMVIAALSFLHNSSSPDISRTLILVFMAIYAGIYISKGGAVDEDVVYTESETEENTEAV